MILLLDPETGRIVDADPEALRIYGCDWEDLTERLIFTLHPTITLNMLKSIQSAQTQQPVQLWLTHRCGSRSTRDLDARLYSLNAIGSSHVLAVISNVTSNCITEQAFEEDNEALDQRIVERSSELLPPNGDLPREISQRMPVEKACGLSEMKYATLVENSLMGIHINVQGRLVFVNKRFAEMHGYQRDELIGMEIGRLIYPDDREMVLGFMACRFQGLNAPREYEARALTKDGRTIWVVRNATVINYRGQRAILGNTLDISQRKSMEQSLRESEKQLHALSAQLINAQERERERIAHELHDGIGQYLTAIKFRVENACRQILQSAPSADVESVRNIVPVIQQAVEEVRRISMDLRPSILDDLGIRATLDWYFREFRATHPELKLVCEVSIAEEEVPEPLKLLLYRLVQEGLHNVVKHSRADRVTVRLSRQDECLQLLIQDNGRGFRVETVEGFHGEEGGFGLAGMKKRTELSGGDFRIESCPNLGTTLNASWRLCWA